MMGVLEDETQRPVLLLRPKDPTAPVEEISLPLEPNLVLEGRICSSRYVDGAGHCTFDRSTITGAEVPRTVLKKHGAEPVEDAKGQCPICTFMRAGPCAQEFEAWTSCMESLASSEGVSKCSPRTMRMTSCMRNFEYYDIFMAGMSEKLDAMEEASVMRS